MSNAGARERVLTLSGMVRAVLSIFGVAASPAESITCLILLDALAWSFLMFAANARIS
jgi:hypothetical protein